MTLTPCPTRTNRAEMCADALYLLPGVLLFGSVKKGCELLNSTVHEPHTSSVQLSAQAPARPPEHAKT
jgi:hypothetical protein